MTPPSRHSRHGLSADRVDAMVARQGGGCLICRTPLTPENRVIDHDHSLARLHPHPESVGCPACVRGILDSACNLMLGFARDSPETLRVAADYVELARRR